MKINSREAGKFINLIRSHSARWAGFYIIVNVLLIALQTGLVFNDEISQVYLAQELNPRKKIWNIMKIGSAFSKISSVFDIRSMMRTLPTAMAMLIFAVINLLELAIIFTFWRFDIVRRLFIIERNQKNTSMYIISGILLNYEFFFFIFNLVAMNALTCRNIFIEVLDSNNNNYLEEVGFENKEYFGTLNRYSVKKLIPTEVTAINDNILCLGANHYLLIVLSIGIIIGNIVIKLIASRITKLNPTKDMFLSKFGNADVFQDFILLIFIASNTFTMKYAVGNYPVLRILFYVYLCLFMIAFVTNYIFRPYLNLLQHNLKSFQYLYLLLLIASSIMARESNLSFTKDELSTIIFMILSLTIMLKSNSNLSRVNKAEIFSEIFKVRRFEKRNVIQLYYIILQQIDYNIECGPDSNLLNDVDDENKLFINFFFKEHCKKCTDPLCFCKGDENFKFSHKMSFYKGKIIDWSSVEVLLLLEELLKETYIQSNKKALDILYCYLYLKINYLGKVYDAYNMMMSIFDEQKRDTNNINVEESAILDQIERALEENLRSGMLCLRKFPHLINIHESKKQNKYGSFSPQIKFINRYRSFKSLVSKTMVERTNFLKELQNSGNLEVMFSLSTKFYLVSQKVTILYSKLQNVTNGDFGPLLLLYSWFLHVIFQNKLLAMKVMSTYSKKYHRHNLNRIFGVGLKEKSSKEFGCVFVGQHKDNRHIIQYCTSNVLDRLGYKYSELDHKDLNIIIPIPIQSFHSNLFKDNHIGGRKFMIKKDLEIYPLHKEGHIIICTLTIRYNCTILEGIQIVGALQFKQGNLFERIALVDDQGTVTSTTNSLKRIIRVNAKLSEYNDEFISAISSMNTVISEKILHPQKKFASSSLFSSTKNLPCWSTFYSFQSPRATLISQCEGDPKNHYITLSPYLVHCLKSHFYILSMSAAGDIFDEPTYRDRPSRIKERVSFNKNAKASARSNGSSISIRSHKEITLEKIIHYHIKPKNTHAAAIFGGLIIAILCIFHVGSVAIKIPIQQKTNTDIKEQLVTADTFSWEIWAQLYSVLYLDILRAIHEGKIPSDYGNEFGDLNVVDVAAYEYTEAISYYSEYEETIDMKVANLSFPSLFDYESWSQTKMVMHFYEYDYNQMKLVWKTETIYRKVAIQLMTSFGLYFSARDYTLFDGSIPLFGEDRDSDPEEEYIRKNLAGDINYKYFLRSLDFYEYLKNVGKQNESYVVLTTVITFTVTLSLFFAYLTYLFLDLIDMRRFYRSIFEIKANDVQILIENQYKRSSFMNELLEDEVDYQAQDMLLDIEMIKRKGQEKIDSNKRRNNITLTNGQQNFGIYWYLSKMMLFLIVSLVLQFIYFGILYPRSKRITNLIKAYILGIETWNSFVTVGNAMMRTIIWNNTANIWGRDSLSVFHSHLEYTQNNLMNNITEALGYDLGNLTDTYRDIITQGNSCKTVYFIEEHPYCYKYFNGLFNTNMYNSLKGVLESFKSIMFRWESARGSWDDIKQLMYMPEMISYLHIFSMIISTTYYTITVDASNTIILELANNLDFVNLYSKLFEYLLFIIFLLMSILLISPIQQIMENYYSCFYIIPFELLEMNMAIRQKIKKIPDVDKFFKL